MERSPRLPPHELGRWGEDRAVRYLVTRGWKVLARNYRFGRREVDVVVRRDDVVAFVEVKTRLGLGWGRPEESITRLKRREIEAVATHFLATHRLGEVSVRFDAVAIGPRRGPGGASRIEHVEDAWRPGWF